ncbi:MAG TPA: polysaccharide biosynthesis/export family protein, partial [Sphingomicrobium sp.]
MLLWQRCFLSCVLEFGMRLGIAGKVVGAVVGVLMLSGCFSMGSRGGPIPYDRTDFVAPDSPRAAPQVTDSSYLIVPGDTLTVKVFQAETLSQDYRVDATGTIAMPLIGQVTAIGVTPQALGTIISQRLDQKYLRKPDVIVSVKESQSRNLTVDGSVRSPGVFPVTGELTLIQAVALARGTDPDANPRRVAIFRTIEGKRMAAAFDLTAIRRGASPDPRVYAGDVVVVDGNRTNTVLRDILTTLPILSLFRPF